MSWTRYLLHDFWTAREFNKLDQSRNASRRARSNLRRQVTANQREMEARIEELEQDLGEAALLVRALTDVCLEKGLISPAEIMAKAEHLDGLDGVVDGRMGKPVDPETPPG